MSGDWGTLYVVSTPVGNLGDLSPRAVETLRSVTTILCEDTRRTRTLLAHAGVRTPVVSFHEHNEADTVDRHVAALAGGVDLALVSDAGTPLLSDPGYRLVRAVTAGGGRVVAVPGPSALLAALVVSGLPTDRFLFVGYPPRRAARLRALLDELGSVPATLVFYESPRRVVATLEALAAVWGGRRGAVCRELTKLHEETVRGTLADLAASCRSTTPRGEFTIVVEGPAAPVKPPPAFVGEAKDHYDRLLAQGLTHAEASEQTRRLFGG